MDLSRVPPLIGLAIELKQLILCHLADIQTLKSMLLVHSTFYGSFKHRSRHITSQVLFSNSLPIELLPEILAVSKSYTLQDATSAEVLLSDYFSAIRNPTPSLRHPDFEKTLAEASALEDFHRLVCQLTTRIVEEAVQRCPVSSDAIPDESKLSPTEETRFHRALYRFQLHTNIYIDPEILNRDLNFRAHPYAPKDWDLFFSHFAPWECEQLASVHDIMRLLLLEPFVDIITHDIEWSLQVPFHYMDLYSKPDHCLQKFLTCGLAFIADAISAKSFDERCRLLKPKRELHRRYCLGESVTIDAYAARYFRSNSPEQDIPTPAVKDPDPGPAESWETNCTSLPEERFMSHGKYYRLTAYTMWDSARLDRWGALDKPMPTDCGDADRIYVNSVNIELSGTLFRRADIWERGGRGWWSWHDESKVVWRKRKAR